jgi:2-polyprenyl-3-methyl-5-hydroxy-6-metoxy-1,4-benzoquinol methylase
LKPRRILDIGVGMGSYGFLLRQHLEIAEGRLDKETWTTQIDGIEIFEGYRNPVWDYAYDQVLLGDVRSLIGELGRYDLILCNDVLEHFHKPEAISIVRNLLDHGSVVIATTPNRVIPQGAWGGNDAETHRCLLTRSDFPYLITWLPAGVTNCYVCSMHDSFQTRIRRAVITCPVPRRRFWRHLGRRLLWKINSLKS